MKGSNLIAGIGSAAVGIVCLLIALCTETKLDGIFWGLTGAGIALGVMQIFTYFHWNAPKNRARYEALLDEKQIEMHDELKMKVRNQAGRQAYVAGLMIICASMLVFSFLGALGIVENARVFVLYLFGLMIVQFTLSVVIFNRLMKQY
ncbi:MAG: hypothetical protein IKU34_10525 [Clostridia bacterium]|nr:hypothetical protein [Clostridia bacterium]